jgi:phage-related protein
VGGTYRAVYTVRFREAVFVLHVFQKKSKRGIATPQADMEVIRQRLKVAAIVAQELKDEEAGR